MVQQIVINLPSKYRFVLVIKDVQSLDDMQVKPTDLFLWILSELIQMAGYIPIEHLLGKMEVTAG